MPPVAARRRVRDFRSALACMPGKAFVASLGVEGGWYEFAVFGDTMNVGACMAGAAHTGEVLIGDTVRPYAVDGQN